jgi:hypothetical protein
MISCIPDCAKAFTSVTLASGCWNSKPVSTPISVTPLALGPKEEIGFPKKKEEIGFPMEIFDFHRF